MIDLGSVMYVGLLKIILISIFEISLVLESFISVEYMKKAIE